MTRTRTLRIGTLLAASALLAACTEGTGATKSGVDSVPVELLLANNDQEDLSGAPAVQHFVDRVQELSGGAVVVRVQSRWKGGADEVQVLRDVAAGDADLGWAGSRALDQVGVRALTPLHAPFLVDSYNAQRAVLGDPEVQSRLEELTEARLTGLALLADQLRIPVGIAEPLLHPEDYAGAEIRTHRSDIQEEGLAALGATPTSLPLEATMDGVETMWWTYDVNRFYAFARFPTLNTPLWPRSVVLVANPQSLEGLDDEARRWVTTAAEDAARWSLEHARDNDRDHIEAVCAGGARIATATPEQVAALEAQVQPLYDRLRDDPATGDLFARVEELAAAAPPDEPAAIPAGCAFRPGDESLAPVVPEQLTAPGDPGDLPEGTYRYELTPEHLRAQGLPENDVQNNAGVLTWTLQDGAWRYEQQPTYDDILNTTCEGFYDVSGSAVAMSVSTVTAVGECAPHLWTATWSMEGDTLTWSDVSLPDFAAVWSSVPWRKIG